MLIAIITAYLGKIENPKKSRLLTATLAIAHIQLILGFLLLIPILQLGIDMSNTAIRFITIEHPLMMLIGVILITVGKIKAGKSQDVTKANKTIFTYFLIALIVVAIRTPWEKLF
jgi:hypothetical protein